MNSEQQRLEQARNSGAPWKKWGPYLSERQWGTVREDYSENGNAWDYFSHDQARSRAYPYDQLVQTNRGRSRQEFEYELISTGIFNEDRYFDVFVEYAKESSHSATFPKGQ
jgi:hypothetical protein